MVYPLILVVFLLSGALALGYQVLWSKFLLDFIGASAYSYATVLASFMAGLAIGSWYLGKVADRVQSPLRLYAYLELAIGIYALVFVPLSQISASWYASIVRAYGGTYPIIPRIVVSALLLLPPTILMGGTYPLMLRHVTANIHLIGKRASQLYAVNSGGAVFGAVAMTFVFIPWLGLSAGLMLLAFGNALLGLIALVLTRYRFTAATPTTPSQTEKQTIVPLPDWKIRAGLLLIFAEGLLAFVYEIAWTRYFGLILGSSAYSFAIMLAAFITGITIGSAILSRVESTIQNPFAFFGWTQIAAGMLVILPLPFYPYLTWVFERWGTLFSAEPGAFYLYHSGKLLLCYLIMLPPTIFIGMAVPLILKALNDQLEHLGQRTGIVYAWNTCGNVAGALLGGLLLLPWLGMENVLVGTSIATLLAGLIAVLSFETIRRTRRIAAVAVVLLAVSLKLFAGSWDLAWFTQVPFRRAHRSHSLEQRRKLLEDFKVPLFRDDPAAHVMVAEYDTADGKSYTLYVNGKGDASTAPSDMATQILLAQVPMMLHPDPQHVLVIGLAAGVTAGSALTHDVERVDAVDIVRSMPRATAMFKAWNHDVLNDPKFRFIGEDGRSYLSYTPQRYDVVISEPSNPWTAGTGSLFSSEFYSQAVDALKPSGFFLQWLQAYEMSDATFLTVVRTFQKAFPYAYGFQGSARDFFLIGSRSPIPVDWQKMETRFNNPAIRQDLARLKINSLSDLLYLQRFSPPSLKVLSCFEEEENNDDNRFLEYRAPVDLFRRLSPQTPDRFDDRLMNPHALLWNQYIKTDAGRKQINQTIQFLSTGISSANVFRAFLTAQNFIQNSTVFEYGDMLMQELPSAEYVAQRITRYLQTKQKDGFNRYVSEALPAIRMSAALSESVGQFWLQNAQQWTELAFDPEVYERTVELQVELLLVTGHGQQAADLLRKWIAGNRPPTNMEWLAFRTVHLPEPAKKAILQAFLQRHPDPFLEKIRDSASPRFSSR